MLATLQLAGTRAVNDERVHLLNTTTGNKMKHSHSQGILLPSYAIVSLLMRVGLALKQLLSQPKLQGAEVGRTTGSFHLCKQTVRAGACHIG